MAESKLLHMNVGKGERSYACSSALQRKVILEAKPVLEDVIKKMLNGHDFPSKCFNMADLGCSSGPNTLFTVRNVTKTVQRLCQAQSCDVPEFQIFLNDLPDNDFNTVFESIPLFYRRLKDEDGDLSSNCFISGMPGSFYNRIFPRKSLHFVHSSYSIHWLSQGPEKIENKNNMYMARESPPYVFEAYMKQFEKDFSRFLQLRAEEIVAGGYMLLTFIGRSTPDPYKNDCAHLDLLSKSLIDLVHQGIIEQAQVDSFDVPFYAPCEDEVKKIVQMEGSFDLDSLMSFQVNWDAEDNDDSEHFDTYSSGKHIAKTLRAVFEQMLVSHFQFGESTVDYLFERYANNLAHHLLVEKTKYYFNIVISLRKRQ